MGTLRETKKLASGHRNLQNAHQLSFMNTVSIKFVVNTVHGMLMDLRRGPRQNLHSSTIKSGKTEGRKLDFH